MDIKDLYRIYSEACGGVVTTDTRKITPGALFFALKGENFNGDDFVDKALELGAAYAVASNDCASQDVRVVKVEDTLHALWELAAWHREHLNVPTVTMGGVREATNRLTVIALTGTNGKTTTKELVRCVLATKFAVSATVGNLNNNIGVPLTILSMNENTQLALVEMGASHPGDINELTAIAHPDLGLITNVGKAHLLGFGSFEGVKATKGELYDYIHANGWNKVFVNADSTDLLQMAAARKGLETMPYGVAAEDVVILPCDAEHPFLRLSVPSEFAAEKCDYDGEKSVHEDERVVVETHLVGVYNAANVMAAIAVGRYFGVSQEDAARAISAYEPSNNRSQMTRTEKNILIVDAYNANPSSMAVALENFSLVQSDIKVAMLGDMRELGAESENEHLKVVTTVKEMIAEGKINKAFLVGEEFGKILSDPSIHTPEVMHFPTSEELASYLSMVSVSDACVLIKGSRGIRMENVMPTL